MNQLKISFDGQSERLYRARDLVHRTHGQTAIQSAAEMVHVLSERERFALQWIKKHPGRTANELESIAGCRNRTIGKRLRAMERAGLIREGETRPCKITGKNCLTWYCRV